MAYEDQATSFIGPVSDEEARTLARLAKAGDRDASERLALSNAGLVYHEKMISRYRKLRRWMPFQDATQEGWLAMAKAVDGYNPDEEAKFSTYAWGCLHNHINTLMKSLGSVRRDPRAVSLGEDERGRRWIEQVEDDGRLTQEATDASDEVYVLLGGLTARDREIATLRFGLESGVPATFNEIAEKLGVSAPRVRQLEARVIESIKERAALSAWVDSQYLERRSA